MNELLKAIVENYNDEELLIADGFNDAIIGIDPNSNRKIYSISKCIEVLMKDMDEEDAREYFNYNVLGAYVGEKLQYFVMMNFKPDEIYSNGRIYPIKVLKKEYKKLFKLYLKELKNDNRY